MYQLVGIYCISFQKPFEVSRPILMRYFLDQHVSSHVSPSQPSFRLVLKLSQEGEDIIVVVCRNHFV